MKQINMAVLLASMIHHVASLNGVLVYNEGDKKNLKRDLATVVTLQLKEMLAAMGDPDKQQKVRKLYAEAYDDAAKMKELCGIRLQQSTNYILSSTHFMGAFFNINVLQNDESPYWQNNTKHEVGIVYVGQQGGVKRQNAIPAYEEFKIPLRILTSLKFTYAVMDLYNGEIRKAAEATVDIAFDLMNKMDGECKALLDTCYGNFTTTGSRQNRTYALNSRVVAGNLPTTNALTVVGMEGEWVLNMIRVVTKYCNRFGANAFADGPLLPTGRIFVSSADATDLLFSEDMRPEGVTNNKTAEGVMGNYAQFDFAGRTWSLIPDNTLASGFAYPELTKKPGEIYLKPGMDKETDKLDEDTDEVTRFQKKVFAGYIPGHHKPFTCRVAYEPNDA